MSSKTEALARRKGEALLKKLKGEGWELNVWENGGWHYSAQNGPLTVHASSYRIGPTTYWCLLSEEFERYPVGGAPFWTARGNPSFEDPNDAVRQQVKIARQFVKKVTKIVNQVAAINPPCSGNCSPYDREEAKA
jgi:hypothetical protein